MRYIRHKQEALSLIAGSIVAAGVLCIAGYVLIQNYALPSASSPRIELTTGSSDQGEVSITTKLLFVGDIYWGRAVNRWAQSSLLKEAYPFSGLATFQRDEYDAWIGNLECPSVPGVNQSYEAEVTYLQFNCPSSYLTEAAKWFDVFSLANNHTANQRGKTGLEATRNALSEVGIQHFGSYDIDEVNDTCEVVAVPARYDSSGTKATIPIALCGYHALDGSPSEASLEQIRIYGKFLPVFVYPHYGVEYTAIPTTAQKQLYRHMIELGADAVFGAHPHWVQPAEVYNDKLIFYSLGNFMFDQLPGETQRGAAVELALTLEAEAKTLAFLAANAPACSQQGDTCLNALAAIDGGLRCAYRYNAFGVDMSEKLTKKAEGAAADLVLDRLAWSDIAKQNSLPCN